MIDGKRNSTAFNVVTTFITRVIILFGGFIASVILARVLGPEGKGIVTAIFVVPLLMVSLADLGIRQATAYYIGKQRYKLSDIFSSVIILWAVTSFFSVTIVAIYFSTGPSADYGWEVLILALITIPLKLVAAYSKGILQGREKIGSINIVALIRVAINIAGVVLLVWLFGLGVLGGTLVHVLMALIAAIISVVLVLRVGRLKFKLQKKLPFKLFTQGIWYAIALFIFTLNYRIDIIFLERMTTPEEVGIYSVGSSLTELIWQLPAAISMVLFSRSANSKSDIEAATRSARLLRMALPIILIICVVIWSLAPILVKIIFGESFVESVYVIRILMPGVFLVIIAKILHPDLAGRGYPLFALWVFIGPLILNIVLNFVLIPAYGMYGAAVASTVSYSLGGITFGFVYARRENIPLKKLFIITKKDLIMVKNHLKNSQKNIIAIFRRLL